MTREERLARIQKADSDRYQATEKARGISPRNLTHPLRQEQRKAVLALADELRAAMNARDDSHVSLRSAADHLGVSAQMLSQRLQAADRIRANERPWWGPRKKTVVA